MEFSGINEGRAIFTDATGAEYAMNVSRGNQELTLTDEAIQEIAQTVFEMLRDSSIEYQSLDNTRISVGGITTDQAIEGEEYTISASKMEDQGFSSKFALINARVEFLRERILEVDNLGITTTMEDLEGTISFIRNEDLSSMEITINDTAQSTLSLEEETANSMIHESGAKLEILKDFEPKIVEDDLYNTPLPQGIVQEIKEQINDKEMGADMAIAEKRHENVEPMTVHGSMVTGYRVIGGQATPGQVVPTSFRMGTDQDANHLMNIYMTVSEDHAMLRTGVVDTAEKAAEFEVAAREIHRQRSGTEGNPDRPIRVVSNQLNSPEREGKMIEGQHVNILNLDKEGFEVVHTNTPSNRFVEFNKTLTIFGKEILWGERESRKQNIEGMSRYLEWVFDDMASDQSLPNESNLRSLAADCKESMDKLQENREVIYGKHKALNVILNEKNQVELALKEVRKNLDIAVRDKMSKDVEDLFRGIDWMEDQDISTLTELKENLKEQLKELKTQEKQVHADIKALRKASRKEQMAVFHKLRDFASGTGEYGKGQGGIDDSNPLNKHEENIILMKRILGDQLQIKGEKLDRGQKFALTGRLDKNLGVIHASNCKSGLDRTGFLYGVEMSIEQMEKEGTETWNLVMNWESTSLELNKRIRKKGYEEAKAEIDAMTDDPKKQLYLQAWELRIRTFDNMMKVGFPITVISTGVGGLKWGKGAQANRNPLNFLPPVIKIVNDQGEEETVELIKYDRSGKPDGLTKRGHEILTQFMASRGA